MKLHCEVTNGADRDMHVKLGKDKIEVNAGQSGSVDAPRPEDDGKECGVEIDIPSHSTGTVSITLTNASPSTSVSVSGKFEGGAAESFSLSPGQTHDFSRTLSDSGAQGRFICAGASEPA